VRADEPDVVAVISHGPGHRRAHESRAEDGDGGHGETNASVLRVA